MWRFIKRAALVLFALFVLWLVYEIVTFPRVAALKTRNPETTSFIEARLEEARREGREPRRVQQWVPLERISPHLQRAVLAGEDSNFAAHDGFDYDAIQKAWDEARREADKEERAEGENPEESWIPPMPSFKRGASTVTQQLAKNLYLSEERSLVRKVREAFLTYFLERTLPKRRILEIYLNVIEWGDGVYGAEAAARTYFNKSAAELSPREAAFLAAMIPNPRSVFNPQPTAQQPKPNLRRVQRRQRAILRGMNSVKMPPGTG
jgi:monofunctional biosynthetic peptidoglycan transglycosylase